jgi:hypothetical protein
LKTTPALKYRKQPVTINSFKFQVLDKRLIVPIFQQVQMMKGDPPFCLIALSTVSEDGNDLRPAT